MVSVGAFLRAKTADEADNLRSNLNKDNSALHGSSVREKKKRHRLSLQLQRRLFLCQCPPLWRWVWFESTIIYDYPFVFVCLRGFVRNAFVIHGLGLNLNLCLSRHHNSLTDQIHFVEGIYYPQRWSTVDFSEASLYCEMSWTSQPVYAAGWILYLSTHDLYPKPNSFSCLDFIVLTIVSNQFVLNPMWFLNFADFALMGPTY